MPGWSADVLVILSGCRVVGVAAISVERRVDDREPGRDVCVCVCVHDG